MIWVQLALRLLSFGVATSAAVVAPRDNQVRAPLQDIKPPLLPDDDPFYKAPPGIASIKLGSILRHRKVPTAITVDNKSGINLKGAWQFLYRTQNSVGEPEASVVTVLVPHKPKPNHLFSVLYFSDAAYNGCNPSINLQVGARNDSVFTQSQFMIALAGLNEGWYVSIADDGGPQAAFAAGPQMAHATLDSIRAVLQSGNVTGISSDAITTMYGYSGGGYTAAWTAELQPTYAPDVNIAGIAFGGLVPNMTLSMQLYNKNDRSNYIPPVILGIAKDYRNFSQWLDENLVPSLAPEFRKAESQCFDSNQMYSNKDMGKYFKNGFKSLFEGLPRQVMDLAGTLGQRANPTIPLYLHETYWDDVSPINATDDLVRQYCAKGASILYERNNFIKMNHSEESIWGLPGAFTWMKERHAGKPAEKGCKVQAETFESFWGWATLVIFRGVFNGLLAWAGFPVSGP